MFKTGCVFFLGFSLLLNLFNAPVLAETSLEIKIFAKANGAPKHYLDENKEPTGYAIDIAQEAMKRAGFTPVVVNLPWKRAQLEALKGNGVITAFSKTPEREKSYDFSEAMYEERVILVYRKDNPVKFKNFSDLYDKKIGVSRGSLYAGEFSKVKDRLNLLYDSSHKQRLTLLASQRIDAGIFSGDLYLVQYNLQKMKLDFELFEVANKPISIDTNHIGVPKNLKVISSGILKNKIDISLNEMKQDGSIEEILSRYKSVQMSKEAIETPFLATGTTLN